MPSFEVDTAGIMEIPMMVATSDGVTRQNPVYNDAGADVTLVEVTQSSKAITALTLTTGSTQDWVADGDGGAYVEVTAAQMDTVGIAYVKGVFTGVAPFRSVIYDVIDPADAALFSTFLSNLSVNGKFDGGTFEPLEDSVPAVGAYPNAMQALLMILQWNIEKQVSGVDVSIRKPGGAAELYGAVLDDADTPSTIARDA